MEKRPLMVTLWAILCIISGVVLLGLELSSFISGQLSKLLPGMIVFLFFFSYAIRSMLNIASGIGLFLRKKWGWILTLFNQIFIIMKNILIIVFFMNNSIGQQANMASHITKYGVRSLLYIFVVYYFLSYNVLDYFEIEYTRKMPYLLKIISVSLILVALSEFGGFLLVQYVSTLS